MLGDQSFMINGLRVIVDDEAMSEWREDWSKVRSPSRAVRRLKRGFPQRIRRYKVPKSGALQFGNKLIMHSVVYHNLRQEMNRK